ncbi:glycosyltransferase [bacterium]|nr:glycosyltransferase [bacterium]
MDRFQIFQKNITALKESFPDLAKRLEQVEIGEDLLLFEAKNKAPTIKVKTRDKEISLHSSINPGLEANRKISSLDFREPKVYLLLGLGYYLFELLKKVREEDLVIVVEKRLDLLKISLSLFDWQSLSLLPYLIIGEEPFSANKLIKEKFAARIKEKGVELIEHLPSLSLYPDYYTPIRLSENVLAGLKLALPEKRPAPKRERLKILTFNLEASIMPYIIRDVVTAFKNLGHRVKVLEPRRQSVSTIRQIEEMAGELSSFRPDIVFTLNNLEIIPALLKEARIPYAIWFIDHPLFWSSPSSLSLSVTPYAHIFVWERSYLGLLKDFGFKNVHWLPLATNPHLFKEGEVRERFESDISFVGESMTHYLDKLLVGSGRLERLARMSIQQKCREPLREMEPIFGQIEQELGQVLSFEDEYQRKLFLLNLEVAGMSAYRREIIKALSEFNLSLYGDEGWKNIEGANFRGRLNYLDAPALYRTCRINLNITKAHSSRAINQRLFDVPACGGFVLTDFREDLKLLFDEDEVAYYQDKEDLLEKVRFYLTHPAEREKIANNARKRVLSQHTYEIRMESLIKLLMEKL